MEKRRTGASAASTMRKWIASSRPDARCASNRDSGYSRCHQTREVPLKYRPDATKDQRLPKHILAFELTVRSVQFRGVQYRPDRIRGVAMREPSEG